MQPRTTGILLVLTLALGAYVYFYEIRGEEARNAATADAQRVFPDVAVESIDRFRLTTRDGVEVEIDKMGGAWRVTSPVYSSADKVNLDAMASTLGRLASESVIETEVSRDAYGLGEAALRVGFRAGGSDRALLIGKPTPVGENTYVAVSNAPEKVLIVSTWKVDTLRRDFVELRNRRVAVFDRSRVDQLSLSWSRGDVNLEKREGQWWFRGPGSLAGERADDAVVDTLLGSLASLQATGFDDEGRPDSRTGLDRPHFEVQLRETGDSQPTTHRVAVVYDADSGRALIRADQSASLYQIDDVDLDGFPRDLFAYRFKQLSLFDMRDAITGELVFGGDAEAGVFAFERGEAGWRASETPWRPGRATRLVSHLADLKASGIVADELGAEELASFGLAPESLRIRVYGAANESDAGAGALLADVRIGQGRASDGIFAQMAGRDTVYQLDPIVAEHLPLSRQHLQDAWLQPETSEAIDRPAEEAN